MFGSDILEVVIGMAFVYLILSLMCTTLNELVMNSMKYRATCLEAGLRELLASTALPGLVERFYKHPLIFALYKGEYDPKTSKNLPSYIPSQAFAIALLDLTSQALPTGPAPAARSVLSTPQGVSAKQAGPTPTPDTLEVVKYFYESAERDVKQTKKSLEAWFDASMDRVSGWYKAKSKIVGLVTALAISVLVNADTLALFEKLSTDKTARDSIVATASTFAAQNRQAFQALDQGTTPSQAPPQADGDAGRRLNQLIETNIAQLKQLDHTLKATPLPLGWTRAELGKFSPCASDFNCLGLFKKLLGLLLTTVALSLGAPFWFQMLETVVRLNKKPASDSEKPASDSKK